MVTRNVLAATVIGLGAAMLAPAALAAPQVLGIVALGEPMPLTCDAAGCRAELSTFCLQQPRDNPKRQAYRPATADALMLIGTTASGETRRLPAADYLRITSERGFTAVRIDLSPAQIAALGFTAVTVDVAANASLIPVESPADANPQTPEEVALATGAVRAKGGEFFDDSGEASDAIRLTNMMINALPDRGRDASDSDGSLLAAVLQSQGASAASEAGIALTQANYADCRNKVDVTHHVYSMRNCLEGSHDRLVVNTNIDFWNALGNY